MTEHEAVVARIVGDFALLEVAAAPGCGSCSGQSGCGTASLRPRRYTVHNGIGARPGDEVIVSVPDGAVLKAAALSYLMPLLLVIAGAAAGTVWGGEGLPAVAGAACGLAAGIAALRFTALGEPLLTLRFKARVIFIDKEPEHA